MSQNTSEKKHIVISENSESMQSMPEISLSGRISTDIKKHRYIKWLITLIYVLAIKVNVLRHIVCHWATHPVSYPEFCDTFSVIF